MEEKFRLDNQLCFRLYSASRLITQAYHPLLGEYGLTYPQYLVLMVLWEKDARQMIVKLTKKGRELQNKLTDVPEAVGSAVLCESVTPETVPSLFKMLDDIINQLKDNNKTID